MQGATCFYLLVRRAGSAASWGENMGRGRQWQGWEVFLLREAAGENRRRGLKYSVGEYAGRLQDVAKRTGRSYAAVRKMAHEIHARSFRTRRR